MLTDESSYKVLKQLAANPAISQRELAREMGVSLGKVNFCIRALIEKGLIKVQNFQKSNNKKSYLYVLTPKGIERKATITARFLKYKIAEYEILKKEIEQIKNEIAN